MSPPRSSDHLIHSLLEAPDYPRQLREHLEESKRSGIDFENAWRDALYAHPPPYGYGARTTKAAGSGSGSRAFGVESPIAFIRRHFEAAYRGERASAYCIEDCDALAERGSTQCPLHRALHEEAMRGAAAYPSAQVA